MPSLIGRGPRQYLLACENRQSFDRLKAALDEELRPADPIERLWVDEFIDLEWDLHRLRTTRHAVLETRLVDRLSSMAAFAMVEANVPGASPKTGRQLRTAARGCIRGVAIAQEVMTTAIGTFRIEDELQTVQADAAEVLARLEHSIHATSRLRDAVLARLYSRRDLIADGRITSGRRR